MMAACAAPGPTSRSTHSTQKHLAQVGARVSSGARARAVTPPESTQPHTTAGAPPTRGPTDLSTHTVVRAHWHFPAPRWDWGTAKACPSPTAGPRHHQNLPGLMPGLGHHQNLSSPKPELASPKTPRKDCGITKNLNTNTSVPHQSWDITNTTELHSSAGALPEPPPALWDLGTAKSSKAPHLDWHHPELHGMTTAPPV